MNRRVIKTLLKIKLKAWIDSIQDESVRSLVEKNTIVTGGAIANMLLNEEVKDYDVYFRDKATTLAVAEYYVRRFNESNKDRINRLGHTNKAYVLDGTWVDNGQLIGGPEDFKKEFANQGPVVTRMIAGVTPDRVKIIVRSDGIAVDQNSNLDEVLAQPTEDILATADEINSESIQDQPNSTDKYRPIFLSTNAITLTNKVQIVVRFYGEPEEIHKNYDFVHCTNYYDLGKDELVLKPEALECLLNRELKYQGSKYPLCSIIRTRKFIKRGFHINAGQYLKMCFQLSQLDLTNIDVLEDQLIGVDSAYFKILIDALQSKKDNEPSFVINEGYVTSIIDKIF